MISGRSWLKIYMGWFRLAAVWFIFDSIGVLRNAQLYRHYKEVDLYLGWSKKASSWCHASGPNGKMPKATEPKQIVFLFQTMEGRSPDEQLDQLEAHWIHWTAGKRSTNDVSATWETKKFRRPWHFPGKDKLRPAEKLSFLLAFCFFSLTSIT